jgi:L-threonylcarbamoyladenylate synthase
MSSSEVTSQWPAAVNAGALRVLDGGRLQPSAPSTVIDCTGKRLRVIRPGAIPLATLRASVPDLIGDQ